MAYGRGSAIRRSATVGDDLLYVAVAIRRGGRLLGVSRVARPVVRLEQEVARLRRSIVGAMAIAFLLTAILALALSTSLAGPLRQIMDSARRFAAGDLSARSRVDRADEMGELARILNHSADQLQARLTEVARERARADAILSSMDEGLLAVDHQGTVLLANESLCRGLSPAPSRRPPLPGGRAPERGRLSRRGGPPHRGAAGGRGPRPPRAARVRPGRRAVPGHGGRPARRRGHLPRHHRPPARGADPPRLRGQRVARAAHAPHLDPRVRRGARGRRAERAGERPALPGQDPRPRGADGGPGGRPARAVPPGVRGANAALGARGAHGDRGGRGRVAGPPSPAPSR